MAAETGFLIDGTVYEVPSLDSLTMGERRVMYELSAITQEDFVRGEDETEDEHEERVAKLMRHPGFMESLMHVAYQRANPGVKRAKVQLVIDNTNYLEAVAAIGAGEDPEEESAPLALTPEPSRSSLSDSSGSSSSSEPTSEPGGTSSISGSGEPDESQPPTGTTRSGTSSPESHPIGSAA